MKLFEDKLRDNYKRAETGENLYNYYDNNQQAKIVQVREILNQWFENYPKEHRSDLVSNFRNSFHDAFYELFIHETFFRQGYILEPHPVLSNSTKRPDFLAKKGSEEFYVEATTISYLSEAEIKKENFKQNFIDELNKMVSPNFWLGLKELEFKKTNFPKVSTLRKRFEQKLTEINPTDIENRERNSLLTHDLKFEDDNLKVVVTLFLKSETAKNASDFRTIGVQFSPVTIKNANQDPDKILKNLKDKAGRYGELKMPFIICLNLDFNFNLKEDVDWAFYQSKGFDSLTPKFTKVSAVFVSHVTQGNIFNCPQHRLIVNKHSSHPINLENLELSFENDGIEMVKKDINCLLNLNGHEHFGIKF